MSSEADVLGETVQDLRVAWLILGDEEGGMAQAKRGLLSGVRALGITPVVVSLFDGPFLREIGSVVSGVEVLQVAKPPFLSGNVFAKLRLQLQVLRTNRAIRPRLVAALHRLKPQIVHVLERELLWVAAKAAHDVRASCVWEMSGNLGRDLFGIRQRVVQRRLSRWGVTVLANSSYTASTLGERLVKLSVIHLGADEFRFSPNAADQATRDTIGIPDDAVVFGVFARLTPEKGQLVLLEAMAGLPNSYSETNLLLVGGPLEGGFAQQLRHRAEELGLSKRVHFLGNVTNPERYYNTIDVAVNARIDVESFGLSVVEAMLMRKPVIVHALGGPAETVVDEVTGWHVTEATVDGFRAGLLRALKERLRWQEMGAAGRARALEYFSLSRQAKAYLRVVQTILKNAPRTPRLDN